MNDPAVAVHDVHFGFRRRRTQIPVLEGADLSVGRREHVAVVGPSGCGKSSLLAIMSGLDLPTQGTVTVCGTELQYLPEDDRARFRLGHVAQIYQDFRLLPRLDALDNVAVVPRLRGVPKTEARERAAEALRAVSMAKRSSHRPRELSGGEQQRVAVARAVVAEPDVLLADEPTGSLDAYLRSEVIDLLREVAQDRALVVVTHDPQVAAAMDRTWRLESGRIAPEDRATV